MPPLRLAILECDTPLPRTAAKYGSYGGVFTALLHAAACTLDIPVSELEISTWDVVREMEYPDLGLGSVDAVLVTGSRFSAFEDSPWVLKLVEFVKGVLAAQEKEEQPGRGIRIVGVCFGHQIVGRAMGAKVARSDRGWEASVCEVELTEKGKEIFGKEKLSLNQMHKDIVYYYPRGVEELGYSPKCEVQGMYIPGKVITVQGHPEFNKEIVTELLETRHQQGIFDDKTYEDGMRRVGKQQDGVVVAAAFLKFLLDGR